MIIFHIFSHFWRLRWQYWEGKIPPYGRRGRARFILQKILCLLMTMQGAIVLTHWGRVTHICISKLNIIGSDNGLSPGRRQAIIWTNAGILLIGSLWTNFREILSQIHTSSLKKMHFKMSSGKWRPNCLVLNVLTAIILTLFSWNIPDSVPQKLILCWWRV